MENQTEAAKIERASLGRAVAPMSMIHPRRLLAILAAVFGPTAAATFRELSLVLFPLSALIVCTLTDPPS